MGESVCVLSELRGVGATRQGKTREVTGKQSMHEGMMDGDGWVAPTDGNGMSTREHWDEYPSVLLLYSCYQLDMSLQIGGEPIRSRRRYRSMHFNNFLGAIS